MSIPWPGCLLLLVHFLEVLAWEKSRYCIMAPTDSYQRDQAACFDGEARISQGRMGLTWLSYKISQEIMSPSAERIWHHCIIRHISSAL